MIERMGTPNLNLCDGNGTERVSLRVEPNGCPAIRLRDGNFTERLTLELGADEGGPEVKLYDRSECCFAIVGQDYEGELQIRVVDDAGHYHPWVPETAGATSQQTTTKEV